MQRIARYIIRNPHSWGFGPVSLAIAPEHTSWQGQGTSEEGAAEFGHLTIHTGSKEAIKILDGQHRRAAIAHVLAGKVRGVTKRQMKSAKASIRQSSISVDLYLIDDDKKVAQLIQRHGEREADHCLGAGHAGHS